jgi:hypothetical protein
MVVLTGENLSIQEARRRPVEMFDLKTHRTTAGKYQVSQNRGFGGSWPSDYVIAIVCESGELRDHPLSREGVAPKGGKRTTDLKG